MRAREIYGVLGLRPTCGRRPCLPSLYNMLKQGNQAVSRSHPLMLSPINGRPLCGAVGLRSYLIFRCYLLPAVGDTCKAVIFP